MLNISVSEWLVYGGIAIMAMAIVTALISIFIFKVSRKKLHEKFEEEYGKIQ